MKIPTLNEQFYSDFIGSPVLSEAERAMIGTFSDFIINPENGKIEGVALDKNFKKIVPMIDVVAFVVPMMINSMDSICEPSDVIKIEKIINSGTRIMGNKVFTKSGVYVGKVSDYAIHMDAECITKLVVTKTFLELFKTSENTIPTTEIVEITPTKIIINDIFGLAKETAKSRSNKGKAYYCCTDS